MGPAAHSPGKGVYYASFMAGLRPSRKLGVTGWADSYRYLSSKATARPGKYKSSLTPYIPGIHAALDDPKVYKVICKKSAQVAWTDGVVNNFIGSRIDLAPCPMVMMFAKEGSAKEYNQEKFAPMVEATPRLADKVDISSSRKSDNRQLFKNFPGGFLKLVGSNSTASVKSTPAPVVMVEEPDDCNTNVKGQGDSIKQLEERTKTYPRRKIVVGGTPSIKGFSAIEYEYDASDQRKFYVPCHECGKSHVLNWDNVLWDNSDEKQHDIYGHALPETACYQCPHCLTKWADELKNENVKRGEWVADAEFRGVAGFFLNELYSPFPGSLLKRLVERYLEAEYNCERGDDTDKIVFVNSALGLAYEYETDQAETHDLESRASAYPEKTVAMGGLVLTAGVDIQHDRIAIILRAWGRGEESWLVYWGEIYGVTLDKNDPVWLELDEILFAPYAHECGAEIRLSAASIDSSDGKSSDAVYAYCRSRGHKGIMAIKGSSDDQGQREIFSKPKPPVDQANTTKASKYGLQPYIVGTYKAKMLLDGRLKLTGTGPGRMHTYIGVRADYYEQVTSEVLVPSRANPRKKVYQVKSGIRNEARDSEIYCSHAARSLGTHLASKAVWDALQQKIMQSDLFTHYPESPGTEVKVISKPQGVISRGVS